MVDRILPRSDDLPAGNVAQLHRRLVPGQVRPQAPKLGLTLRAQVRRRKPKQVMRGPRRNGVALSLYVITRMDVIRVSSARVWRIPHTRTVRTPVQTETPNRASNGWSQDRRHRRDCLTETETVCAHSSEESATRQLGVQLTTWRSSAGPAGQLQGVLAVPPHLPRLWCRPAD